MNTFKWGILGCGRIAGKFAADLKLVEDAELVALGSRSMEKVSAFAETYPAKHIYGSYEELAADPNVDAIYIATPHSHHHEHTLLCLQHNKAVLCEKAFAINARQAGEMIREARDRKVFLMEALWSRFLPHFNVVKNMIDEGQIGKVMSMQMNFGFKPADPVPQRIFDPKLGGGTLLDIGIYNVFFVHAFMGMPDEIQAIMKPAPTGVDEQLAVQFKYNDGRMAQLLSSFSSNLGTEADIAGDAGRIRLHNRFYEPSTSISYFPDKYDSLQHIPFPKEPGWGYQHQVRHVHECLRKGLTESPVMTLDYSLELMTLMDRIRHIAGIHYEVD
jgi:predicted dehydrogenase